MGGPTRIVVRSDAFVMAAVLHIRRVLQAALDARGAASVAVAGGSTPRPVYAALATGGRLDWSRIDVFFGDERAVPPDDPASNYRMVREALLDPAAVPEARVHRMKGEQPDLERAADDYAAGLPARLDLVILGIGADGHTASLFPGAPTLGEHQRLVVPATGPVEPRTRLTVTPPVIEHARNVIVLATGSAKARAVARAGDPAVPTADCPAALARRGFWILDEAAAGFAADAAR
jgi:6-phosphogluconolactonase